MQRLEGEEELNHDGAGERGLRCWGASQAEVTASAQGLEYSQVAKS